ncbi:[NiFe]-hydrogenase assembly chaperone HybE [Telmatospirillum sp. J64-1]|uniref:[NiFe]-hydrogenase assembly chaperone HybE n=1 Tax=Telmatospirillum sp. J64-1 TaxID=2502183 RepID=UPI00115C7546|nr:[NiFe]-hydrogenase assembly chaperone HybE [Telmatospirillum sp. J64-1]
MTAPLLPGIFTGGGDRLGEQTRLECGVCWHVYDPARGCEVWEIPPGTPFAALPDHWRCPNCDNEKSVFLPLDQAPEDGMDSRVAALVACFEETAQRMCDLPVHNPALRVDAVGFRPFGEGWLGILITPWFMNIVLLPKQADAWDHLMPGAEKQRHALPAGSYDFEVARAEGMGTYQTCSLFSPMHEFADHEGARLTAEAAIDALMTAEEEPQEAEADSRRIDRRDLLRGRFGGPEN